MSKRIPIVAIIGRTNVGKSTIYNAVSGRKKAITDDFHGVTRDRSYSEVSKHGFIFKLIDTGGLIGEDDEEFQTTVKAQAELAINEADVILAVLDGLDGLHYSDHEVADSLRKSKKDIIWVVNKCEKDITKNTASEFYALGIDSFLTISAAHNEGIRDLIKTIKKHFESKNLLVHDKEDLGKEISIAVLGKPNVGKSTLINKILGEERLITSEQAGTTRDSIDITFKRDGINYKIVDTAGLRKKARIEDESVERFSNLRALTSLAQCDVVLLLIDGSEGGPTEQDAKIAGLAHERGKGLVVVVNKWDIVEKDHKTVKHYEREIYDKFKFAKYAPILFVSALTGKRCPSIISTVDKVYQHGIHRIATSDLNDILRHAFTKRPPAVYRGEPIKLFFSTQVGISPPTFVLFVNFPKKLNFSYQRYLKNSLRNHFKFEGHNIKLHFRKRTSKTDRANNVVNS